MQIRTITYFVDPGFPLVDERIAAAGRVAAEVKASLAEAGYTVQTVRLALPPFGQVLNGNAGLLSQLALDIEAMCFVHKLDYASLGPARPADGPAAYDAIPAALAATEHVFAAASIAEAQAPGSGVSLPAVRWAAEVIRRCGEISPDGFGNLRFAALANVPAGSPFFPAAYHDGGAPVFSLGVEAADLAVTACQEASSLADARLRLVRLVEEHAARLVKAAKKPGGVRGLRFGGIDFTLAPFPEAARSLGSALERLTGQPLGGAGTLAAAAFLAGALDRAKVPAVGFAGLFFPVLEDSVLAARAAEGRLTVNDLLLYSTVCGAGLDTLPLPGAIDSGSIAAILLDVAALALRLNKPLTARLMPIPGKQAGDEVRFDGFPFFAPSRVLNVRAAALSGLLSGDETFEIAQRVR
ncbi:MAG: DUF711 family protein [Anaerolineales bacterium]